jgi:hypothetical protein
LNEPIQLGKQLAVELLNRGAARLMNPSGDSGSQEK